MDRAVNFVKSRKWWIVGGVFLIIALVIGMLLPNWILKWQINKMELDKVERVEYIEYEGNAFSSPIKIKKDLSLEKNKIILDNLIKGINEIDRKKYESQQCNKILFFYHSNGEIFNAYVEEDLLGFNYGDKWLRVEKLNYIIEDMNLVESIRIKEENI